METKNRYRFIKVRVTEEEREAFAARAQALGVSVSDLIRQAAFGTVKVRALDSDAAFELRRIGAMLKHLYPKESNWTADEKKRYWSVVTQLLDLAQRILEETRKSSKVVIDDCKGHQAKA